MARVRHGGAGMERVVQDNGDNVATSWPELAVMPCPLGRAV